MFNQIILEQKTLLSLLNDMQPICSKRTTLEVTEYILFQINPRELILKATDLEISLQASSPLEKHELEPTQFLVSGKRIFDVVKELDGNIQFGLDGNQLRIKCNGVDLSLNIRDAQDFPPFPERIENLFAMDANFLRSVLDKLAFLIPQNNANMALNGMLVEMGPDGISFVTTDGHCLANLETNKYTLAQEKKWLLPRRAVLEIKKILDGTTSKDIFVGTCNNQLVFSGNNFNFFTKLLAEAFPHYKPILARDGFKSATLAKNDFVKTLKRANSLLAGQFISTKFQFKPGKLDVSLQNKDVGKLDESINLDVFEGEIVESRFYSPYLLNGLSVVSDKDINIFIKHTTRPIIFESKGDEFHFTYLVMPVSSTA